MTATTTPKLRAATDSFLRFALRADATCSGLMGIAAIPLAGWLAEISGTSKAFEYSMGAFFIAFAIGVFVIAARPSVKQAGIVIAAGNVLYTVGIHRLRARRCLTVDHHRCGAHIGHRRLHPDHGRTAIPGRAAHQVSGQIRLVTRFLAKCVS